MLLKLRDACNSKKVVILIVFFSLFIDLLITTCVVPVLPQFMYDQHKKSLEILHKKNISTKPNTSVVQHSINFTKSFTEQEKQSYLKKMNLHVGIILASKPILQIISNLFFGALVDRVGPSIPLFAGYLVLIASSLSFAVGTSFVVLLLARAVQGIGSSLVAAAGYCLLAESFVDDEERKKAISHALNGVAIGTFVGPTFGSFVYSVAEKAAIFYIVCGFLLILLLVQPLTMGLKIKKDKRKAQSSGSTFELLKDPYVMLATFVLLVASTVTAVMETGMPTWMMKTMRVKKWQYGIAFIPYSIAYIFSTFLLGFCCKNIPNWLCCALGVFFTGAGSLGLSFVETFYLLLVPGFLTGLGASLVDNSIYVIMAHLVDARHHSQYGSVYAISESGICAAFAIGNLAGGAVVSKVGFPLTMRGMCGVSFLLIPLLFLLRKSTKGSPSVNDENLNLLQEEKQCCNDKK